MEDDQKTRRADLERKAAAAIAYIKRVRFVRGSETITPPDEPVQGVGVDVEDHHGDE